MDRGKGTMCMEHAEFRLKPPIEIKRSTRFCTAFHSFQQVTESMVINRLDVVETKLKETNRFDIMAIDSMHIIAALFLETN